MSNRKIKRVIKGKPTLEGAGVHLRRAFGFGQTELFDPFLLLDDFRGDDPELYKKGFPWHPHRGIETITYVTRGTVEHSDSMGNKGVIGSGDVQWMTAGNGIIHQEMPKGDPKGFMWGFQLWANLPASQKMMDPRYREVTHDQIPEVSLPGDVTIKVIAGNVQGTQGPVRDVIIEPEYLDVMMPPNKEFTHAIPSGHTALAYIFGGEAYFSEEMNELVSNEHLVLFDDGEHVRVTTKESPVRFLLLSGKPIREPVAWYGPIVMNTQEQLQTALDEYRNGTFIKQTKK
jgi:redox-sensitive bicupin YhaK (pirin superfamily)